MDKKETNEGGGKATGISDGGDKATGISGSEDKAIEISGGGNRAIEPTRAQLEILQVLWKHGPSTVRFVNDQLNQQQKQSLSYTSTLKLMQIMHEKGMVQRDESNMTHVYSALMEEQKTRSVVLKKFMDSMYEGSVKNLLLELLGNQKASGKDWDTIKELLDRLDE